MSLNGNATATERLQGRIKNIDVIYKDAYRIAVENGFEGTITEWLASLKGEKGDPAPTTPNPDWNQDNPDSADYIRNKPNVAEIDDATVAENKTWSSNKINEQLVVCVNVSNRYTDGKVQQFIDDAAELADIRVGYDGTTYPTAGEAVRQQVGKTLNDVVYEKSPNLYNPTDNWTVGRWNYSGDGGVYNGTSSHVRNINPIALDITKEYNIRTKSNGCGSIYVLTYDEDMTYLGYKIVQPASGSFALHHITNAAFVNFSLPNFSKNFPDTAPLVMVWETTDETDPGEWTEYGEGIKYVKENQTFTDEQIEEIKGKIGNTVDESLKAAKARFDDRFNFVAYSKVTGSSGPINTAEHFEYCGSLESFTSLKGDVQPTSDGGVVMCHDVGFTFDSNGRITTFDAENCTLIHDLTTEECLALEHKTQYSGLYCKVISFEKYLQICKRTGKIALITVRDEYIADVVAHIVPLLERYHMTKRCIVNSFTISTLQAFRDANADIMLSYVLYSKAVLTKAHVNQAIALGNCLVTCFHFPFTDAWDYLEQSKDAIEYAHENDIRIYEAQTGADVDIDKLMQYGIMGSHMTEVP